MSDQAEFFDLFGIDAIAEDDSTPEGRARLIEGGIPRSRWPRCHDLATGWDEHLWPWCDRHMPGPLYQRAPKLAALRLTRTRRRMASRRT